MNRRDLLKVAALGLASPLRGVASSDIPVAFLVSDGAVIIDFCGPWEVFQDAGGFRLYTVAESKRTIRASGGMQIVPDHDFASAPAPKSSVSVPLYSARPPPPLLVDVLREMALLLRAMATLEL